MHTAERFWSGRTPAGWNIKIAIKRRYRCRERCFDTVSGIRQALLPARANKRKTRPRVVPPPGIIGARCLCVFFFPPFTIECRPPWDESRAAGRYLRGQEHCCLRFSRPAGNSVIIDEKEGRCSSTLSANLFLRDKSLFFYNEMNKWCHNLECPFKFSPVAVQIH